MAKITGKNTRPGSNKATGRDYSKEKTYQSSLARKAYRSELNAEARERASTGNGPPYRRTFRTPRAGRWC
jgi:hypothetical protein